MVMMVVEVVEMVKDLHRWLEIGIVVIEIGLNNLVDDFVVFLQNVQLVIKGRKWMNAWVRWWWS